MLIQRNRKSFSILFLLSLSGCAFGQQSSGFSRPDEPGQLAFTAGAGIANYLGDLNQRMAFRRGELDFAVSLGISYRLTDHLSARAEGRIVRIKGSQRGTSQEPNNLSFRSTNPELTGGGQLDLLPASSRPIVNSYLAAGVGFTYLSPKVRYQNRWVSLPPLDTEGESYSRLAVLAYGGAGLSFRLPRRLLLSVEMMYTLPSSDYVDDVSTVYPFASSLRGNDAIALSDRSPELGFPLHEPGAPRGYTNRKDTYLTGLVKLTKSISSAKERYYRRDVNCIR